jgi:hypothetical protein
MLVSIRNVKPVYEFTSSIVDGGEAWVAIEHPRSATSTPILGSSFSEVVKKIKIHHLENDK